MILRRASIGAATVAVTLTDDVLHLFFELLHSVLQVAIDELLLLHVILKFLVGGEEDLVIRLKKVHLSQQLLLDDEKLLEGIQSVPGGKVVYIGDNGPLAW